MKISLKEHQNETITSELDSAYQKTPKNTYFYHSVAFI